jgi:hypothetical protein
MELVKVEVEVPKELKEVSDFVVELVKDLKDKKAIELVLGENLPNLLKAIEGFDQLGEEVKSAHAVKLGGLLAADLVNVFTAK